MLIARQKIRYLVVLNENFLTQIATRLAPENDYVLLRIGIILKIYPGFTGYIQYYRLLGTKKPALSRFFYCV